MGTGKDLWNQLQALYNKEDWAGSAALYASDADYAAPNLRLKGREAIRAYIDELGKAFSDHHMETSLLIEDGNTVIGEWTGRSTNTGPLTLPDGTEMAATGKTLEVSGVTICEVRDGKFATKRDYYDTANMTRQLSG